MHKLNDYIFFCTRQKTSFLRPLRRTLVLFHLYAANIVFIYVYILSVKIVKKSFRRVIMWCLNSKILQPCVFNLLNSKIGKPLLSIVRANSTTTGSYSTPGSLFKTFKQLSGQNCHPFFLELHLRQNIQTCHLR